MSAASVVIKSCLICKNKVDGNSCSFCGSKEFVYADEASAVSTPVRQVARKARKTGWLTKEGGDVKSWLPRYFVLSEDGFLAYHTSDRGDIAQLFELKGKLRVSGSGVSRYERSAIDERDGYVFSVRSAQSAKGRDYLMEAPSHEEREDWCQALIELGARDDGWRHLDRVNMSAAKEGYLSKVGGRIKTWKRRYFILLPDRLDYYKKKGDREPKGSIPLTKGSTTLAIESPQRGEPACLFSVTTPGAKRAYTIAAYDGRDREEWLLALATVVGQPVPSAKRTEEVKSGSSGAAVLFSSASLATVAPSSASAAAAPQRSSGNEADSDSDNDEAQATAAAGEQEAAEYEFVPLQAMNDALPTTS